MAASQANPLVGVEAYIFDVFGTVVDWYGNITQALAKAAPEGVSEGMKYNFHSRFEHMDLTAYEHWLWTDWDAFANEWRTGYFNHA